MLAGCASTSVSTRNVAETEQLAAVQQGNVQTSALPPIGPNGEVQGPTADPSLGTDVATAGQSTGSFESVPAVGALPNSSGRDLSGGLTPEKLSGRWTVVSGGDQCALNFSMTQKPGTGRYRVSAPGCGMAQLGLVASWQVVGTQVQLYDENGDLIAALILSGNRFIGTLSGGRGISMVG